MRPIRTNSTPHTYSGKNVGPDCGDLPCRVDDTGVTAIFALTDDERRAITQGANIELKVWAAPLPPVALAVTGDDVREEWLPDDLRCENDECGGLWREDRGMSHCGHCGGNLVPAWVTTAPR